MLSFILMVGGMFLTSFLSSHWVAIFIWFICLMIFSMKLWYSELFGYNNIMFGFGWDFLSGSLVLLTVWVFMLMIISSMESLNQGSKGKLMGVVFVSLFFMLIYVFLSLDLMMFYLMFEGSLIPTLVLIFGWGYQPERVQAGVYLLFYTLLASLPLLISLLFIFYKGGSLSFLILSFSVGFNMWGYLWMLVSNVAFLVKIPMYFVHLWLPKAHVEAPISGSMILAGILLKLGGYGFIRLMNYFYILGSNMSVGLMSVGLVGGVISSLMCMRQADMKSLIAYSSIGHMGFMICGAGTFCSVGMWGALSIMVGHGLCSSGLFCLANINYGRLGSRSMLLNKGIMVLVPSLSLWWFMLVSSNIAAPPSLNLLGEVEVLMGLLSYSSFIMGMFFMLSFFGAVYSLYLFGFSQHGNFYSGYYSFSLVLVQEYLLLLLHWAPLNMFLLKSDLLIS